MYSTDGDFGRVRLVTYSQYRNYENYFNCITICGWHCCNDKYCINRLVDDDTNLILYTTSGVGELSMNGIIYRLLPDTAIIIKANTFASYYTPKNGIWEFYWIHFKGKPCMPLIELISRQSEQLVNIKGCYDIKTLTEYALGDKNDINLNLIIKESDMLSHILHKFIGNQSIDNLTSNNQGIITKSAVAFIQNNYRNNIGIQDISKNLYISCEHLIRTFKKENGISPYVYLSILRIEKAKELLRLTNISVEKISQMVGFRSHSNFSKQFKGIVGVTPVGFRNGKLNGKY